MQLENCLAGLLAPVSGRWAKGSGLVLGGLLGALTGQQRALETAMALWCSRGRFVSQLGWRWAMAMGRSWLWMYLLWCWWCPEWDRGWDWKCGEHPSGHSSERSWVPARVAGWWCLASPMSARKSVLVRMVRKQAGTRGTRGK